MDTNFLDGKLLIAMPGMGDPRFTRSVIFMCAHSRDGAMGLMINKPATELSFAELLAQLEIDLPDTAPCPPIYLGGPVEHGRGFVLHSTDYAVDGATMKVDDRFAMTATVDILRAIAGGSGPENALLALGYSGWGPGQLEGELQRNGWLTVDAEPELVFATPATARWDLAMGQLGIDPRLLSSEGGTA